MKKLLIVLFTLYSGLIYSQSTPNIEDYMSPEQKLQYVKDKQLAEMEKKMEHYGKWVGVGGEVGQAINDGLMAVVDVSDKFSKTDIGKFTIIMVAWKVMGKDVIRIILGLLFLFILIIFMFKSYKSSFTIKRVMIENPGLFKYPKKYKVINPLNSDDNDYESYKKWENAIWYKIFYAIIMMGGIGITYAIMFG